MHLGEHLHPKLNHFSPSVPVDENKWKNRAKRRLCFHIEVSPLTLVDIQRTPHSQATL